MHKPTLIVATLALALLMPTARDLRATGSTGDVVFEWNQILQDTVPGPQGVLTPRYFSMTHIAMFDAINAIEREFEPYRVRVRPWAFGSPEAAAAQAAHDVLVAINPAATATYDAALVRQLDRIHQDSSAGAQVSAHASPKKSCCGARPTGGWSRRFRRTPSRRFRDATSRPRRTTPHRRSPIFNLPRRWRCRRPRCTCRPRRQR